MIIHKHKNMVVVAEGCVILVLLQILLALVAEILYDSFPFVPKLSMYVLCSGITYPVLTVLYLWIRTRHVPKFRLNREVLLYSIAGMVFVWAFLYFCFILFGAYSIFVKRLIQTQGVYKYINVLWLVIWAPITEEIIFRGYFLELLLPKGTLSALLITSVLFVTMHLFFNNYALDLRMLGSSVSFFFFSMTVGFIYTKAGLVSAIFVHVFSNFYFLMVNL